MNPRETTIFSIALGSWMAWRFIGSSLLPVGSAEIGVAIIVLFKPWLDFRGWTTLLAINAMSCIRVYYYSWGIAVRIMDEKFLESMILAGVASEGFGSKYPLLWTISLIVVMNFIYAFFIWPYICERIYRKSGIWGKLIGS